MAGSLRFLCLCLRCRWASTSIYYLQLCDFTTSFSLTYSLLAASDIAPRRPLVCTRIPLPPSPTHVRFLGSNITPHSPSRPTSQSMSAQMIFDPDCVICNSPANVPCECEAQRLDQAVHNAEQRMMSGMLDDIRYEGLSAQKLELKGLS